MKNFIEKIKTRIRLFNVNVTNWLRQARIILFNVNNWLILPPLLLIINIGILVYIAVDRPAAPRGGGGGLALPECKE